jgi:hypothetical protein
MSDMSDNNYRTLGTLEGLANPSCKMLVIRGQTVMVLGFAQIDRPMKQDVIITADVMDVIRQHMK